MKKRWSLALILFLSFWAIRPFFAAGFFPVHDDTQAVRVWEMAQALREGQFPVRWVGDLGYGYGYPLFNFYAPLAYYAGALFNLIGFDVLLAAKLMMLTGILLSAVTMYFLAREFWGEVGGIISGLFYLYAPYHALDIYVRGAVGEFWAMAFLPLVFLSTWKISRTFKLKWVITGGLSLAAVILSHNLTAMMLIPFILFIIAILFLIAGNRKRFLLHFSIFGLLGLGLSAFYWLPALTEMNLTKVFGQVGGGADFRDHFVFLDQLWASPWGFGGSAQQRLDGMSFMIGKLHLVLVLASLVTLARLWLKKTKADFWIVSTGLVVFLISVLLTNRISGPIWERAEPMAFIQYPWRFLIFSALAASFLAGSVARWFKKGSKLIFPAGGLITLGLILFNGQYFQPQYISEAKAADYLNEENLKWTTSGISDEYLPRDFPVPEHRNEVAWEKVVVSKGEAEIKNLVNKADRCFFEIRAETVNEIVVKTAFYPGWRVWVNGKEKDFNLENGQIKLSLPAGNSQVAVRLTDSRVRRSADYLSLLSLLGLIFLVWPNEAGKKFFGLR